MTKWNCGYNPFVGCLGEGKKYGGNDYDNYEKVRIMIILVWGKDYVERIMRIIFIFYFKSYSKCNTQIFVL